MSKPSVEAKHRFVVIPGASHHSFGVSSERNPLDLKSEISDEIAQKEAAVLISQWLRKDVGYSDKLSAAELRSAQLATPIIEALKLEGSAHVGLDICNSDFPTNPTCNYPKYPDFSLPPGPAPAPSPLPASNCICGSKWVEEFAFPSVSGAAEKGFRVTTADAFHDVSDEHPFHLPHTWNSCQNPSGCTLNVTTLTMNEPGLPPFPSTGPTPLSALELRTKMKSRQTLWEAAGLGSQSVNVDKQNLTLCRHANQMSWDWALANADATVRSRFLQSGEPFVMLDDKVAPIGLTGPTWIQKELNFTRTPQGTVEVQSWTFVVAESPIKSKYLPTGMHYCKLLSPARCMEWIYTDGLRTKLGAGSQ
jgi:hypothetical protein